MCPTLLGNTLMGIYGVRCYLPHLDLNRTQSPIASLVPLGSLSMFHAVSSVSIRTVIYGCSVTIVDSDSDDFYVYKVAVIVSRTTTLQLTWFPGFSHLDLTPLSHPLTGMGWQGST